MIKAVLIFNNFGKPRLTKFYQYTPVERHQEIIRAAYLALSRRGESHCSFVEDSSIFGAGSKLVYRHFATLYFVFIVDEAESELATLDLIQEIRSQFIDFTHEVMKSVIEIANGGKWEESSRSSLKSDLSKETGDCCFFVGIREVFVEALEKCFQNVCEVDVIFNFPKVHAMLDEVVMGGQVLETNIEDVLKSIVEVQRLEKKPDASMADLRARGAIPSFPLR